MEYRVGICQFEPVFLQPEVNRRHAEELLRGTTADLIVLPELATSGYLFLNQSQVDSVAEDAETGPTAQWLLRLSRELDCSLMIGFPEKADGRVYNSALLMNPDGTHYLYRKTHLFFREKLFFAPGNTGFNVATAKDGVLVGMMICFDWFFPESARTLAHKGAQILVHPANLVLPWCQQAMTTRSLENRVFSITCNRVGTETIGEHVVTFTGGSQVLSPLGEILYRASDQGDAVHIVTLDPGLANDKAITPQNDLWGDLREEYYR